MLRNTVSLGTKGFESIELQTLLSKLHLMSKPGMPGSHFPAAFFDKHVGWSTSSTTGRDNGA